MALKKSNKDTSKKQVTPKDLVTPPITITEAALQELGCPITDSTPEGEYLTQDEKKVLTEQHQKETEELSKVSTEKMEKAVSVIQDKFNLSAKNFSVNGFQDGGAKCTLKLSNEDFDLQVVVKDTEKFEII